MLSEDNDGLDPQGSISGSPEAALGEKGSVLKFEDLPELVRRIIEIKNGDPKHVRFGDDLGIVADSEANRLIVRELRTTHEEFEATYAEFLTPRNSIDQSPSGFDGATHF